jgi:hypothetical protein
VAEKYGDTPWWSQMVRVIYKKARGLPGAGKAAGL